MHARLVYYIYCGGFALFFHLMGTVFSIYHIQMVGLNPFQLVIVGTILEASCFLFEIPTGIVADNYSRKLSIIAGLVIVGAGIFLEGSFPLFWTVVTAQVIWGAGATFLSGADTAWIADEVKGKNLDHILLKGAQIRQIAALVALFGGIALATIGLNLPFLVSGIGLVLLGGLLFLVMPEDHFKPVPRGDQSSWKQMAATFRGGLAQVKKSTMLKGLFLVTVFGGLYSEGYDRLWTFRFLEDLGLPAAAGLNRLYWFAPIGCGAILLNLGVLHLVKKRVAGGQQERILWMLSGIYFLLSASIFFFAIAGDFFMALSLYWLSYAMRHANGPLNDYLINREIDDSNVRATVISMRGQVDQAGQMVGGPLIGLVAKSWSVSAGLGTAAMILLPVLGIFLFLIKKMKK